jgi:hypothetical protein
VNNGCPQEIHPERKVPTVETQLEDTFKAARDNHINTISVTFILYPLPTVPAVTANTNISIDYILAQVRVFNAYAF